MERASTVGLRFYLAEALAAISVLKYAKAEAVLGWLNSTIGLPAGEPFEAAEFSRRPAEGLREAFRRRGAEITHLKFLIIARGKAMWTSMTQVKAQSVNGWRCLGVSQGDHARPQRKGGALPRRVGEGGEGSPLADGRGDEDKGASDRPSVLQSALSEASLSHPRAVNCPPCETFEFGVGSVQASVATGVQVGLWQVVAVWGFGITLAIYTTAAISGCTLTRP